MEAWLLGVVMALLAALAASLGDNLIKLSFTQIAVMQEKGVEPPPVYKRPNLVAGNFCLTVLNTGLNLAAMAFADASLTIPFGGVHICANLPLAYYINNERSTRRAVGLNLVIFLAVLIVLVSGNRDSTFFTASELWALCFKGAFVVASLAMAGICVLCKVLMASPKQRLRKVGHTVGAGVVGSLTQLVAKAMSLCLKDGAWDHPILYFFIAATIALALTQVYVLNRCLDMYTASFVVPIVNATIIVLGSIYSAVYFREMERWDLQARFMLPFGIMLCAAAITGLANEPDADEQGRPPAMSEMSVSISGESDDGPLGTETAHDGSGAGAGAGDHEDDEDEGLGELLIQDHDDDHREVHSARSAHSPPSAHSPNLALSLSARSAGSPEVYVRLDDI